MNIELNKFGLDSTNITQLDHRTYVIKKWNWEYSLAHGFQKEALLYLQEFPQTRFLICCNHPRVLTNGRGLQRPRKGQTLNLVEFKSSDYPRLPFPLHQIERGGGLTFHHPGQFIFYPIIKLNPKTLSLSKMIDDIFNFSIAVLENWGIQNLSHSNELLGIWHENKKLASMGIAIEKLTTYHGMALNLYLDLEMRTALNILNPCGLSADTYISAEELISLPHDALETFYNEFIKKIATTWTELPSHP